MGWCLDESVGRCLDGCVDYFVDGHVTGENNV